MFESVMSTAWEVNFECRVLTSSRSSTILLRSSLSSLFRHISAVTTPGGETKQTLERRLAARSLLLCMCVFSCLGSRNSGWRNWWDPGAKSLGPSCKTQSSHRSPPAHTSQTGQTVCFDNSHPCVVCTVSGLCYLHGAPAHRHHLEQSDRLHLPLSAVAASWPLGAAGCCLGLFALDVLGAFMDPLPSPLGGSMTWREDYYAAI